MKKRKTIISQSNPMELREQTAVYGSKRMFSAASFFDVIEAKAPGRGGRDIALGEPTEVPSHPAIVAFYGFRGGAGRTLALAHVAIMLAQRGLRIAAVDFDLEAPGLHVALGADPPIEGKGLVPLLQKTLTAELKDPVNVVEHLQVVSPKDGTGKILLLPAGRITRTYLAQIEELGVGLWHEPEHSPLERILASLRTENPDVIFIDCRTGFSGMSASVLFHHADLAVIFLPLTEQVWDGVEVLLQAVAAARTFRDKKPGLLFVPSMVPSGEPGQEKVKRYLAKLSESYAKWLPRGQVEQDEEEAEIIEDQPWLDEGIVWDPRLSSDESVRQPFMPGGPWGLFQPLCDTIVAALDLGVEQKAVEPLQIKSILDELQISKSVGFAEDLDEQQMQRIMVPSESVKAAVDRASALIVGAKGSGKTLLWRYLVEEKRDVVVRLPSDTKYVVGHAPKYNLDPQGINLSEDAFKELEQAARMHKNSTYKAFWILYALLRLSRANSDIATWLDTNMPLSLRALWRRIVSTSRTPDFAPVLNVKSISTLAEDVLAALDEWLVTKPQHYVLVFDGLDSGFDVGKTESWYERRESFVTGLLQVVAAWRSRLKRLQFKVFLREDIYLSIELQNRSHLDTAKHELRFGPSDLWQLALKIATTSTTYNSTMVSARTGSDGLYLGDDNELKALLFSLWGRIIEKGKKAYTANYILKRTSDAQGRLFPRTFIQMLDAAVNFEKKQDQKTESDRVLRFRSLREGVIYASKQRASDLLTEYVELKPYLRSLQGAPAVASADKLIEVIRRGMGKPTISLHRGPGGWSKVLERLITVGVLGKKMGGTTDEGKLSVALLYRDGLGMKSAGLR